MNFPTAKGTLWHSEANLEGVIDPLHQCLTALRQLPLQCWKTTGSRTGCWVWIDTSELLEEHLSRRLPLKDLVCCFDCEWAHDKSHSPVSVIALSFSATSVLLLDALSLSVCSPTLFGAVLGSLLQRWLPVGFGIHQDIERLARSYGRLIRVSPEDPCFEWRGVDLRISHNAYSIGLAELCLRTLGVRVSKAEQCSAWEQRPLDLSQLEYAAKDALTLWRLLPCALTCNCGGTICSWFSDDVQRMVYSVGMPAATVVESPDTHSAVKTLAVMIGQDQDDLALCCLLTQTQLDLRQLGANARLATHSELATRFMQPRGGVGLVGPRMADIAVYIDTQVAALEHFHVGAGLDVNNQLRVTREDLEVLPSVTIQRLAVEPKRPGAAGKPARALWWHPYESEEDFWQKCSSLSSRVLEKLHSLPPNKRIGYLNFSRQFSVKKEVYESCELLSPDGQLLARCNRKKIDWYVRKSLADIVCEVPVVRATLRFEPDGRRAYAEMGSLELDAQLKADAFYTQERKNICVVCGSAQHLHRFHVVAPNRICFRVIALTTACAEQAANAQYSKDTELVARYCVDAQTIKQAKPLVQTILAAKRAVKAILGDLQLKIPQTRRQELEAQIVDGVNQATKAGLLCAGGCASHKNHTAILKWQEAMDAAEVTSPFSCADMARILNYVPPSRHAIDAAGAVVDAVVKNGGVSDFVKEWRRLFMQMNPSKLPDGWGVESKTSRAFGKHSRFHQRRSPPYLSVSPETGHDNL